jgi:serine/threonine protein kinase
VAPEVIETTTYYKTSDIWSLGCTVIELLTCNPPYFDISPPNAMFKIVSELRPPLPDPISQVCWNSIFLVIFKKRI